MTDSLLSLSLSEEILYKGQPFLDDIKFREINIKDQLLSKNLFYTLENKNNHAVYTFPNGGSLLSIPFILILNQFQKPINQNNNYNETVELNYQKIIASIIVSLIATLIFLIFS